MANLKKEKLTSRIQSLEAEMRHALQKKMQGPAFNVPACTEKIRLLKSELARLG